MNKNNKVFMLVEVIITSTVIATAMVSLYSTFNKLYTSYNQKTTYHNIDSIFATKITINYLLDNNFNSFINNTFATSQYKILIDDTTCFNNNDSSRLMVYSYNNISKESTMEGYYDIIGSIDSNVTIVTSNLEDHYFSLIYDDEKFEYFNYRQYYNNAINAITYIYPKKDKEYYSYITKYICDSFKIICVKENY